jgi:hypothetical protein
MDGGHRPRGALVDPRPSAPQHSFDCGHRSHFPAELREHPGRDERGDKDYEPDANHGRNGIAVRVARNRVFPSKTKYFPTEMSGSARYLADLQEQDQPVSSGQVWGNPPT